ncbi:39S ribosomal protein L22, mitochondrial [Aphelenchoides fujianensis]|nr:39S ribosomal protein L22, mitochondrial [Aphelenchoides fujianensis]
MNVLRVASRGYRPALTARLFNTTANEAEVSTAEAWKRRRQFAQPKIQRDEKLDSKVYYAPEKVKPEATYHPRFNCHLTPDKWEYQNKVVWPIGHVVAETGLPKAREVFHCEESIHFHPKKIWSTCQLLEFLKTKAGLIVAKAISQAKKRAETEFHVPNPSDMFVAEVFAIQSEILKSQRRHARENWQKIRHRYIHVYVRLEEGSGPGYKGRKPMPDGWEKMDAYYEYLRNRELKYSL